jgi:arginine/lysine/ornithine decarboxylase
VVLTAASYDGALVDLTEVFTELARHTDDLTVLVDEAWSAANRFHPRLVRYTAAYAARWLQRSAPQLRLRVLITQSAHKSLCALRQGSYLHVIGDAALQEAVDRALYRLHPTSPSLPILASLDLARAHAVHEAGSRLQRAIDLAARLRERISTDPSLRRYDVAHGLAASCIVDDPTKVLIDVDPTLMPATELAVVLYRDFGIYLARTVGPGLLVNVSISSSDQAVEHLVGALRSISASTPTANGRTGAASFVIAYPPGVPIVVPGEEITPETERLLDDLAADGADIFAV